MSDAAADTAVDSGRPDIAQEMLAAPVFPHPVSHLIRRETAISWVILTGQYAYKIKKPVHLDFIDATQLETRRAMCEQEVQLNRRLAPDLYLGVVPICRERGGPRVGGAGVAVEYAVKMREFDESQELVSLLERDSVSTAEMTDLAQRLAEFHQAAPSRADGNFADTEHLHGAVLGNLATLLSNLPCQDGLADLGLLIDWTHDALHDLLPRLRLREQLGFIRECHGDLHARNIVRWNLRLVPFDCLDFAPDLRWIDVMNDVAFLVMDLIAHERPDLSCAFLNRYLELTGDYDGLALLPFYAVYRALVRAMVDSIDPAGSGSKGLMRERMRKRIGTAVRFAKHAAPTLVIMHGPSGSGKSWLSERLIGPLNAVRIRSDVERKRLGGTAANIHSPAPVERGIYDPGFTHRTYARLLECAGAGLDGGFNMLIDAAFLRREHRRMFEDLADEHRFALVIISCEADPAILVSRINARQLAEDNCSDADLKTLEWQLGHASGLDDAERPRTVFVKTDAENCVAEALAAVRRAADRGIHLTSRP